jgi:hypothetical protein
LKELEKLKILKTRLSSQTKKLTSSHQMAIRESRTVIQQQTHPTCRMNRDNQLHRLEINSKLRRLTVNNK